MRDRTGQFQRDMRRVFSSPIVSIGRFRCPAGDPLWSSENVTGSGDLIVFPRTATGIHHADCPPVVGTSNVAVIYNLGQSYRRRLIDRRGDACEWFSICRPVLCELIAAHDPAAANANRGPFPFQLAPVDARVFARQRRIYDIVRSTAVSDPLAIEEQTLAVFEAVITAGFSVRARQRRVTDSVTQRRHRMLALDACEMLALHFREPLGLADLADALDVTPFHLSRVFRRWTGWTLHGYLSHLRLRRGFELLRDTDWSISRIALHVSFASHSHFTESFRRAFDCAPSAVRQSHVPHIMGPVSGDFVDPELRG